MTKLEFSETKVVGKAIVEMEVTENVIESIMVGGLEGGIGYWACLDNTGEEWDAKPKDEPTSLWATKLLLEGKEIRFTDAEEEDEDVWILTLDKLLKGYALNRKHRPRDSSIENGDATTCDCIIQYALFDKVVYG